MTMGEKILKLRKARGWSQEELADRAGVSRQAVSRWESGSAKPDADRILTLCDLFGISADYLLREDYDKWQAEEVRTVASPSQKVILQKILEIYGVLSAVCLFGMKFLSSIFPKVYVDKELLPSGETVTHAAQVFLGFVMYYNLEWFLVLVLAGIAVGIALIWRASPGLQRKVRILVEQLGKRWK